MQEFGISTGEFTNFPANQNYLKQDMTVFYVAPYIRTGKHEFSAGIVYPLSTNGLYATDHTVKPRLGAIAGYKFYLFDVYGRENLFIHYLFQYLRYGGAFDTHTTQLGYSGAFGTYTIPGNQLYHWTETDMYINNVIGLGYNLFLDSDERFGFYYTLDYIISQAGYKFGGNGYNDNSWATRYIWNNLSTHLGFSFKLTSLKKKDKK
jgi:hypothetical protein